MKPAPAVAVAGAGLALAVAVAALVDAPAADTTQLVGFAGGGALVAGCAGSALLHALRRRSTRAQAVVVALTSVVATGVGATAAANAMFLSAHDYGARVGLGVDMGDVADYVADNDAGTAELLLALHRARFAGPLVLASSMVVYGEGASTCGEHGVVRAAPRSRADLDAGLFEPRCPTCAELLEPGVVDEDTPCDPRNVYAATKLHQEHLCGAYGREAAVPVTALRYHNVYGPRMPSDTPYAGVASIFRSAVAAGRAPQVYEDGRQRRDFVHVRDVARANVLALTTGAPVSGALNVASGEVRTVVDLAAALAAGSGRGEELRPVVTGAWRLGDVRHVVASPRRATELLGFTARTSFAEGMAEMAEATAGTTDAA